MTNSEKLLSSFSEDFFYKELVYADLKFVPEGGTADEYRYYTEQIDVSTDKVVIQCNMNEKYPEIASTIIYTEWCRQSRW